MLLQLASLAGIHFIFLYLRVMGSGAFPEPPSGRREKELFAKMKRGDEAARAELIERNLRLVAHIVKKYDIDKNEQEDLISIGTVGLIKAIDSFRFEKNTRFATYAGKCVQNEILMYFRAKKKRSGEVSLTEPIDVDKDGNPLTILDVMQVEDNVVDVIYEKSRTRLCFEAIRACLTPREKRVLCQRYGLGGRRPLTQRETAASLGISRSYVSRIEKAALKKLRDYMEKPRHP